MRVVPVLIDSRPSYLGPAEATSLLLLPAHDVPLAHEILRAVRKVTLAAPVVLPTFKAEAPYQRRLLQDCPGLGDVVTAAGLQKLIRRLDPSDAALFVRPTCYPLDGLDLRPLCETPSRASRHLLALEGSTGGAREVVHRDQDGRLRYVQRYFEPVVWPFPRAVIASLIPVSWLHTSPDWELGVLEEQRRVLAGRGLASEDVVLEGEYFDLMDEQGALGFTERRVRAWHQGRRLGARRDGASREPRASVAASASLVGAVVVCPGAQIDERALIVGPTVIGRGARIGVGAVVAQCVVLPEATIGAGETVRHRVVASHVSVGSETVQRRSTRPDPSAMPTGRARPRAAYVAAKAVVEPILASVALVMLAPLIVLLALLVLVDSPGPVLYGDEREGQHGKPFRCWKFRTMRTGADALQGALLGQQQLDGPQFKMERDPRVTRVGRWLRRLNLDELPQLWNVLLGEMSLVGPRPSPFRENQICVPWRYGRLSVRPGMTGLWQICRRDRARGDFHQWIRYDLLYVGHMSPVVDARILLATVLTLGGRWPVPVERVIGDPGTPAHSPIDPAVAKALTLPVARPAEAASIEYRPFVDDRIVARSASGAS